MSCLPLCQNLSIAPMQLTDTSSSWLGLLVRFPLVTLTSKELVDERNRLQADVEYINKVLIDLDELGDIMNEMLETQEVVEVYFSLS